MRSLLLLSMMLPAAAVAGSDLKKTARPPTDTAQCSRPDLRRVDGRAPKAGVHKLGEMPPARALYAVVREIDGCPIPVGVPAR